MNRWHRLVGFVGLISMIGWAWAATPAMAGDAKVMNEGAVRGMALFKGKARCILCHSGLSFTDNQFHNLGVPQVGPRKEELPK